MTTTERLTRLLTEFWNMVGEEEERQGIDHKEWMAAVMYASLSHALLAARDELQCSRTEWLKHNRLAWDKYVEAEKSGRLGLDS